MALRALVFDVDGTLADTERQGHLPACNAAFAELGYPVRWSWDEFKTLLAVPGNASRMRQALAALGVPAVELEARVEALVALKRRLYIEEFLPALPLRAGIERLVDEAVSQGVRLAIVSTSDESQIEALLRSRLGGVARRFDPVLGQRAGVKTAPDSPLYRRCLELLGGGPDGILAIEDSAPGLKAAHTAGLACAVFYNDYTFGEAFAGATLVARSAEPFSLSLLADLCL